ncbi:MAG: hypothetical protein M0Z41_20395 [Peptococcaceae bacterium]|jgi:hypothetical protein|nr:hypothetical protein [Peptococcaceae bacterium]
MAEGFSPAEVQRWLNARCFDAVVAKRLAVAGLTFEDAVRPYGGGTIGYAAANMDPGITRVLELLGLATQLT